MNNVSVENGVLSVRESTILPTRQVCADNKAYFRHSVDEVPQAIYPVFHVLRADSVTLNLTVFPEETLRGQKAKSTGMYSLIHPFKRPYLANHDRHGEIYGRVINAFWSEDALGGKKALGAVLMVPHPYAISQILSGNWITVSAGIETEEATCSICGADWINDRCDHNPYDDPKFSLIMGKKGFVIKEISNVSDPAEIGAIIQATNVDPTSMKMFASNPKIEQVYDLNDPARVNLLETANDADRQVVEAIHIEAQRVWREFAPIRKRWFDMSEKQTTTPIAPSRYTELGNECFGVLYVDENAGHTLRRFPIPHDITDEERAWVITQINAAGDLNDEQRTAVLDMVSNGGDPLVVPVGAETYEHLYAVVDELEDRLSQTFTTAEAAVQPTEDNTSVLTEQLEAVQAELASVRDQLAAQELVSQQATEQRKQLLIDILTVRRTASQPYPHGATTVDEVREHLASASMDVLEFLYAEGVPSTEATDIQSVQSVEDPLAATDNSAQDAEVRQERQGLPPMLRRLDVYNKPRQTTGHGAQDSVGKATQ